MDSNEDYCPPETIYYEYGAKKFLNSDNGSLLISLNHEAISKYHEEMQVSVPDVIKNLKEFKKILRSLSWVRKGYVEEVYKIQC